MTHSRPELWFHPLGIRESEDKKWRVIDLAHLQARTQFVSFVSRKGNKR
jgi:hypothetical protein